MDANAVATPLAAFVAGLITSIHCAGMCGPLPCALFGRCSQGALGGYQLARVVSYAGLGGLLGLAGSGTAGLFRAEPARALPWLLAAVFLCIALGLEKRVPQPRFIAAFFSMFRRRGGPVALSLATPFLPCGPLYLMFGVALVSGSFIHGAALLGAFAFGTLPLLWLAQSQLIRLQTLLPPAAMLWTRKSLALISAALLVWRAVANGGLGLAHAACH
jgi:sulfite exporter TauE/SafE